ncbi:MAG: malate synthase A [Patescibacteria group bacterium]
MNSGKCLEVVATNLPACADIILTKESLSLVESLTRTYGDVIEHLLAQRVYRQKEINAGKKFDFLPETAHIRNGKWKAGPIPADIFDRTVEMTGPASLRKGLINGLNSGANVYMADSEDSESPTFSDILTGQWNLRDAVRKTITFESDEKKYQLEEKTAVLMYRPRGLHLPEKHVLVDGEPVPAWIFDVAMFLAHNAKELLNQGITPCLYTPKTESYLEARLINDILERIEYLLGLPKNSVKVTVLIETISAVFEMHEIIWELLGRIVGLNCGRWDYLFSLQKKFFLFPEFVLPDPGDLGMDQWFLTAYSWLLIQTCHQRGILAMGGMAAQIPSKDEAVNALATEKINQDKEREAKAGHDGTWVAHPKSVKPALLKFRAFMPGPNQLHVLREDVVVTAADLLAVPKGKITEKATRQMYRILLMYLEGWLRGVGAAALENLMEDVATAEKNRVCLSARLKHKVKLEEGGRLDARKMQKIMKTENLQFRGGKYPLAKKLVRRMIFAKRLPEFLTLVAYEHILSVRNLKGDSNDRTQ